MKMSFLLQSFIIHIGIIIFILLLPSFLCWCLVNNFEQQLRQQQQQQQQHDPHFETNRNVIVHLFEWKFVDVANECEDFLGPKGFGGVQLSPVNEYVIVKNDNVNRPWWERYQPISYIIESRSGNEQQFLEMSKRCNKAGVRLYVDVVFNHMAAPQTDSNQNKTDQNNNAVVFGTAGSTANPENLSYPFVPYGRQHFHKSCTIKNYNDAHEIRNCMLGSLPDLDHSKEHVVMKIVEFLNHLIELGVAGFRIDAAKHIWPSDLNTIYNKLNNLNTEFGFVENSRPFIYQEVIDLGGEAISKTEYSSYGVVTEFLYSNEIGTVFNGLVPLTLLKNWGSATGFLPSQYALVFVDNHDNQRGHGAGGNLILTHKTPKKYIMAVAFMLAYPYGIPRIMSSYKFNNSDQGPPSIENDVIDSPEFDENDQCKKDWVCEHRWNSIANMVEFRNLINNNQMNPIKNWLDNGENQISFCCGNKGFIAFNNDPKEDFILDVNVTECLKPGIYCDVISGKRIKLKNESNLFECTGDVIEVKQDGIVNINITHNHEYGVIVIHEKSKIQ